MNDKRLRIEKKVYELDQGLPIGFVVGFSLYLICPHVTNLLIILVSILQLVVCVSYFDSFDVLIAGRVVSIIGLIVSIGSAFVWSLKYMKLSEEIQQLAESVEEWSARTDRFDQLIDYSLYMRMSVDTFQRRTDYAKFLVNGFTDIGVIASMVGLFLRPFDKGLASILIRVSAIFLGSSSLIEIGSMVRSLMSAKFRKERTQLTESLLQFGHKFLTFGRLLSFLRFNLRNN